MSDLLQQAIIDAAALKEAAIKNAENTLVEKYSQEFKQTVERLLEQEQAAATPPTADASVAATPAPINASGTQTDAGDKRDTFKQVKTAFLDGPEDELITINFDQIRASMMEMLGHEEIVEEEYDRTGTRTEDAAKDSLAAGAPLEEQEEEVQEYELDESLTEEEIDEGSTYSGDGESVEKLEEMLSSINEENMYAKEMQFVRDANMMANRIKDENQAYDLLEKIKNLFSSLESKDAPEDMVNAFKDSLQYPMEVVSKLTGGGEELEEEIELVELEDPAAAGSQETADAARLKKQAAEKEQQAAMKKDAATKEKAKKDAALAAATPEPVAESIELSEEELMELAEEMRVDLKPESQGRGYMGSTTVEKQRLMDVERAAARDDAAAKMREEEKERLKDLVKENTKLKVFNDKMLSTLETLKEQVEKMNVSNAKLLYTNKALANVSLNERQKNQIVESISKADSVLAAKTIYETLQNAVESASIQKEAPQTLRETLNRAQSPFVVKKTAVNSINDVMAERMKALAGIKK